MEPTFSDSIFFKNLSLARFNGRFCMCRKRTFYSICVCSIRFCVCSICVCSICFCVCSICVCSICVCSVCFCVCSICFYMSIHLCVCSICMCSICVCSIRFCVCSACFCADCIKCMSLMLHFRHLFSRKACAASANQTPDNLIQSVLSLRVFSPILLLTLLTH